MVDRVMAIVAFLMLVAFVSVIPIKVPHLDLIILVIGCVALAGYDMYRQLLMKRHH